MIDRECDDLEHASARYGTLVQSIRMISCDRRNVWAPSERRYSAAAIGVDRRGRVLFIHARTAWPIHELVKALLALPIDLAQAMYVEGGPEAQIYARGGEREVERVGTFEGAGVTGALPDPQHDLPEVPVLLHHPVRLDHVVERKHLLDDGDDGPVGEAGQRGPGELGHDRRLVLDRP
jgi:hypothetical protein